MTDSALLLDKYFETAFDSPEGIEKLKELILTLAMKGKLVPQDPKDPPASELLKQIAEEKSRGEEEGGTRRRKGAKGELPAIDPADVPYKLPEGWEWVRFGEIAQHNSGKTLDSGRNRGVPRDYITTSNLYWGRFVLDNVRQMLIQDEELERCTARYGDLLICEGGEAGRAAVWELDYDVCFQNHVHRARFFKDVEPFFAFRFFEKLNATGEINHHRKGVGISNMSSKALSSILFPLPPLPEQKRIVAKIEKLMARVEELARLRSAREEKRVAAHRAGIAGLWSSETFAQSWGFLARHFEELHRVPETVAELRKAVLQLGVMGKLVPQDPKDPPASELLKEIAAERARLVKEGKMKAPKPLPPISPEEVPFEVPKGWEWVRLGEVLKQVDYGTSQKTCDNTNFVPVYRMGNIQNGQLLNENLKYISPQIEDLPSLYLDRNDILFNRTNSYELVGKAAIYNGESFQASFASYLIRLKANDKLIKPEFLLHILSSEYFRRTQIEPEIVQQCGQANFNGSKIKSCIVPLPSLHSQNIIVEKIEELMGVCDELERVIEDCSLKREKLLGAVVGGV